MAISNFRFLTYENLSSGIPTHTWSAGYYGSYFLNYFDIPDVLNTSNFKIGNIYPMFYGKHFYLITGILSYFTGPEFAIKAVIFFFSFILWITCYLLIRKLSKSFSMSVIIALSVLWAVYPLTNYFVRNAYIEWFGNVNIWIATTLWILSVISEKKSDILWYKVLFVFFMILGVNGHAITTFYSSYLCVFIILASFLLIPQSHDGIRAIKYHFISLIITGTIIVAASLPWLYACIKFGDSIYLARTTHNLGIYNGLDNLFIKLLPISYMIKDKAPGFIPGTLTAQVLTLLAALGVFMTFILLKYICTEKHKKPSKNTVYCVACAVALIIFGAFILINNSVLPNGERPFFKLLFAKQQFAYRSTNQVNLCIFFALAFLMTPWLEMQIHMTGDERRKGEITQARERRKLFAARYSRYIAVILAVVAFFSVVVVIQKNNDFRERNEIYISDDYTEFVRGFHGSYAYYIFSESTFKIPSPDEFDEEIDVFFNVDKRNYDTVYPTEISLEQRTLVNLQMYPFSWNHLYINGQKYSLNDLYCYNPKSEKEPTGSGNLYLLMDPGDYVIEYRLEIPQLYIAVNAVAKILLALSFLSILALRLYLSLPLLRHSGAD